MEIEFCYFSNLFNNFWKKNFLKIVFVVHQFYNGTKLSTIYESNPSGGSGIMLIRLRPLIALDLEALCAFERRRVIGCARAKCVYLAVILSKKEQEIYPFSVINFILLESKDTLYIPWWNILKSLTPKPILMSINVPWMDRRTFMNRRVDSKWSNVGSFIHRSFSVVLTISLDPIIFGFIGVSAWKSIENT